ncbi:hypothetical protein B5V89_18925 [Heyndrickxia sporothermodurans]|uniref:hypothetical protein n=1 Tax=Heyndrickxia sporothermodurans TaxID=46224 RepID=UPI000D3B2A13|nr:hypothetical protein [Heyndrickxia sporothermodurans]PTY76157.1 hypothetical protein B5V89_18925 [Heyndrickxia sporothermodurans]
MDQELKDILERLETSVGKLENGQAQTNTKLDRIDKRFDAVDQKFVEVDKRFDAIDQKFVEVDKRLDTVDSRLENLETGQIELKDMLKQSTTLLIENFTSIRQDLRQRDTEMNADINLLFRKTEKNERDIEKIKSKLKI